MGKFAGASSVNVAIDEVTKQALPQIPVPQQPTPEVEEDTSAFQSGSLLDDINTNVEVQSPESQQDLQTEVEEGIQQGLAVQEETQRPAHRIEPLEVRRHSSIE